MSHPRSIGSPLFTMHQQLLLLNLLAIGFITTGAAWTWHGVGEVTTATTALAEAAAASRSFDAAVRAHEAVRADVLAASVGGESARFGGREGHGGSLRRHLADAQVHHGVLRAEGAFTDVTSHVDRYLGQAQALTDLAARDPVAAEARLPSFLASADASVSAMESVSRDLLSPAEAEARGAAERARTRAEGGVLLALPAAWVILSGLFALVGRSLVRRLRALGDVARAMAGGDLHRAVEEQGSDEFGALGRALEDMASGLEQTTVLRERDIARARFAAELSQGLELADDQPEAVRVVTRGLQAISSTLPMELLLADSSHAHLELAAKNDAHAACCPVDSPWSCAAVRRASLTVFPDAEAVSACPRLRGRGVASAVCAPVSFMGRSIGVVHGVAPTPGGLSPEDVERIRVLAMQAGARLGTLRVMEETQLQARTDGLTGLLNRRSLEVGVRRLVATNTPYVLVIADLDHFKKLNDTFGHDAGDQALRRFSQVLRAGCRASDLVTRFGGEEFVVVLPHATTESATALVERMRAALHDPALQAAGPAVTASFGLVEALPAEAFESVLRRADAALYRAKETGRDRVVVGDGSSEVVRQAEPQYGPVALATSP